MCGGLWADIETFESLFLDGEKQTAVLRFVRDRKIRSEVLTKTRHVPCPYCYEPMVRNASAHEAGVILDICNKHGAWFDPDEFPKIVKFVIDGSTANPKLNENLEIAIERLRREYQETKTPVHSPDTGSGL